MAKYIDIDKIIIDHHAAMFDSDEIESSDYMQKMIRDFDQLPPIRVIKSNGALYLADGHHRLSIAIYLNYKQIDYEIVDSNEYIID